MSIADDVRIVAEAALELGTGTDGHPWAYDPVLKRGFKFTDRRGRTNLSKTVLGLYVAAHGKTPSDTHVKRALDVLEATAQRGAVLESLPAETADGWDDSGVFDKVPPGGILLKNEVSVVEDVLARLSGRRDIFLSDVTLTRATVGDDGRVRLEPMREPTDFVAWCREAGIHFFGRKETESGRVFFVPEFMPEKWAKKVLRWHRYPGVLPVAGVARIPVVAPDGSLVTDDGYDPVTGLYFDIDPDLRDLPVPEAPSAEDVALAVKVLTDVYAEFPWGDTGSLANAIGLAITAAALKPMFPTMPVPIHGVSAASQSSGKSVVANELPGVMSGGYKLMTFTTDEAETRKRITTELVDSSERVLCFDNIKPGDVFESAVIASALTSTRWSDRLLGKNAGVTVPQDRVWTVTGNNLKLGRDMAARTVPITIDPGTDKPAEREFDVRLDDADTLMGMRPALITAVLTGMRAWVLAGRPQAKVTAMRQFTGWAERCGGVLALMGVTGHLSNLDAFTDEDDDVAALGVLYAALFDAFGADRFTVADAVTVIAERPEMDEQLPSWLGEKIERQMEWVDGEATPGKSLMTTSDAKVRRSLGNTFKNRHGQFYGGRSVVRVGVKTDGHRGWRVRPAT